MSKRNPEKVPVIPTLKSLPVGGVATFELARLNVVKNSCSTTACELGTRYSTHLDRKAATITVTRVE